MAKLTQDEYAALHKLLKANLYPPFASVLRVPGTTLPEWGFLTKGHTRTIQVFHDGGYMVWSVSKTFDSHRCTMSSESQYHDHEDVARAIVDMVCTLEAV